MTDHSAGVWTRMNRLPGGPGLVLAIVSIPLIVLLGQAGVLVALTVLCVYPILDVPRTLAKTSWVRAAPVAALVWVLVFGTLTGITDSVHHLGENAMVFLLPFMLYPLALVISGLVRIEGRMRGRPPATGPRRAATVIAIACGLFVAVPVGLNTIPFLIEKITGNTPLNTVYSKEGDVVAATDTELSVSIAGSGTETFLLQPDTAFDFRGPGSPAVTDPAGPVWLKPGQRVSLEYVYRDRVARASQINIWIERKGCAGDERWQTTAHAPGNATVPSLAGSTWEAQVGDAGADGRREITRFIFMEGNQLAYQDSGGARQDDGGWKQDGASVILQVNDCYAEYEGRIDSSTITGTFANEMGARAVWTARRVPATK